MCIYCGTTNYRKIYEKHHGPIPVDSDGRRYHIHHIDGNHDNNEVSNLKAVSIQEHFDIHLDQGDWGACMRIAEQQRFSPEQISEFSSRLARERVANGTHNFQDKAAARARALKRIAEGNHPFVGNANPVHKRVAQGTHNFLGGEIQRQHNRRRLADGTHHLLDGSIQREAAYRALAAGTHPSQIVRTCPHCNVTGKGSAMKRWHMDNCKQKASPET